MTSCGRCRIAPTKGDTLENEEKTTNEEPREYSLAQKAERMGRLMHRYYTLSARNQGAIGDPLRGQGRVLALLAVKPETTQRELSFVLDMRQQSLSELLAKLEEKGFVTREKSAEDGRVTVSGVDSGKLEVRELKAPKGYTAFEGTRSVTVKAEGLDVDQVAAAKPKLTITAESPLRADSADGSTGSLEASLINTPTGTPPSITTGGFMPSTGDMAMYAAAAAAVAGAALIVVALLVKRGGGSHKE